MAYGTNKNPTAPRQVTTARGVTISKREYVGSVSFTSAGGFEMSTLSASSPGYDINAGNRILFPWLSEIARNYELFRFTNLTFDLVSSVPTTYAGRIYAAIDYDIDDAVATTPASMLANMTSLSAPVWQSATLRADPAALNRSMPAKYVISAKRTEPEPRTAFSGFLMIAGMGLDHAMNLDLWASYTVELSVPQAQDIVWIDQSTSNPSVHSGASANTPLFPDLSSTPSTPNITPVAAGVSGVPLLAVGPTAVRYAWKLGHALTEAVDMVLRFTESAVTPANVLLKAPVFDGAVFDSTGTQLGVVSQMPSSKATQGPNSPISVNTAGGTLEFVRTVALKSLREYFPAAAYVAPYIQAASALTAGTYIAAIRGGFAG